MIFKWRPYKDISAALSAGTVDMEPTFQPDSTQPVDPLYMSPDSRFIRSKDVLGRGAFKTVYRGVDTLNGTEVAFNMISLERLDSLQTKGLFDEVQLLRRINSPYIISFYDVWLVPFDSDISAATHLVFVTELMGSGTISQYMQRAKRVNLATIKRWCTQILQGLNYLHSLDPPVIHRDVKPDNIFLNTNLAYSAQGEVKIGDLGLSRAVSPETVAHTVAGTPEFMAPECFDGSYDVRADIYAFGLTLLEMCTFQYPYKECRGAIGVYRRVSEGIPPESLQLVTHQATRDMITLCIGPADTRPTASQLLNGSWLKTDPLDVTVFFTPNGQMEVQMSSTGSAFVVRQPPSEGGRLATGSQLRQCFPNDGGCSTSTASNVVNKLPVQPTADVNQSGTQPDIHVTQIQPNPSMSTNSSPQLPRQSSTTQPSGLSMAPPPFIEPPSQAFQQADSPVTEAHSPQIRGIQRNILSLDLPPHIPPPVEFLSARGIHTDREYGCRQRSGGARPLCVDKFGCPPSMEYSVK